MPAMFNPSPPCEVFAEFCLDGLDRNSAAQRLDIPLPDLDG